MKYAYKIDREMEELMLTKAKLNSIILRAGLLATKERRSRGNRNLSDL